MPQLEGADDFPGVPQSAGAGWVIHEKAQTIHKSSQKLGDYNQNVGEITAILQALDWLKRHRYDDEAGDSTDTREGVGRRDEGRLDGARTGVDDEQAGRAESLSSISKKPRRNDSSFRPSKNTTVRRLLAREKVLPSATRI